MLASQAIVQGIATIHIDEQLFDAMLFLRNHNFTEASAT